MPSFETLEADFALFPDWEDKYRYVIELGEALPPLAEDDYQDRYKVSGCVSQVWLIGGGTQEAMHFRGTSDAHIVRGLIAILFSFYDGKSAEAILAFNAEEAFARLGLQAHLTPQRSNGFDAFYHKPSPAKPSLNNHKIVPNASRQISTPTLPSVLAISVFSLPAPTHNGDSTPTTAPPPNPPPPNALPYESVFVRL